MNLVPEKIFGLRIKRLPKPDLKDYPLYVSGTFDVDAVEISGIRCITLSAEEEISLSATRKIVDLFLAMGEDNVIVCSPKISIYQRERLSEENIAFITSDENIFLPFLGTKVSKSRVAFAKPLSPQAQRLFLNILNRKYVNMTASQVAAAMDKSLPSVSKYLKEIETISPSLMEKDGRERILRSADFSRREIFERFQPYLASPVKERVYVRIECDEESVLKSGALLSGVSVLSRLSMLAEDSKITFAVQDKKGAEALFDICKGSLQASNDSEEANAVIEIWKYLPDFHPENCVDEISLYLSLQDEAAIDERVHKELEGMLKRSLDEGY